ncbi:MAG: hypothetical protein J2P18_18080, partial [Nocardia sp.]|nr:hypothetical protein [Nocardia sp.]
MSKIKPLTIAPSSRTKAVARTAGSATLAVAALAAITSAGGWAHDANGTDVKPAAMASSISATAGKNQSAAKPAQAPAPAPAP